MGGPARGADVRGGRDRGARRLHRHLRTARCRQLVPDARAEHRLRLPRQRPLVTERDVLFPEPRRRDRRDRLAYPAGRRGDQPEGPRAPAPRRRHPDPAPQDPRSRRERAARPRAASAIRGCRLGRVRDPRRPRPHLRRARIGPPVARLRHDHQRSRLHRGRQGGDPRGTRRRLGGERDRGRRSRPYRDRERHHARSRLQRLRLRRHEAERIHRDRSVRAAGRLRPEQGGRRRHRRPATTSSAPAG